MGVGVFTEEDKFHQRLRELKTIVANLNRLNLTPAQAGQRDALAKRVATVEGNVAKGRADAEAKVAGPRSTGRRGGEESLRLDVL